MSNEIFTVDDNNNAAVRTVSVTGIVESNKKDIFTKDENGNAAVRVVGGGGGGEPVDYSRLIIKSSSIPTAGADEYRKVYMYVGTTNSTYAHGYIYECQKTSITYTGTVSFEAATLSGTTVACNGDDFAQFLTEAGADPTPIVSGTMTYDAGAGGWRLVGKDAENNTVTNFLEYNEDYADAGFTFTGTPVDGDVIAFTCTVEEDTVTYGWVRIDVQPQPAKELPTQAGNSGKFLTTNGVSASWATVGGLPSQSGQSGKFLTTNGSTASWETISALQNTATGSNSLTVGGTATTQTFATNVGINSKANSSMDIAIGYGSQANGQNEGSVAVGHMSISNGSKSVAIGTDAKAYSNAGISVGKSSQTGTSTGNNKYGIAIGYGAKSTADYAIQFGRYNNSDAINSDANTVKIANANGNFEMMNANGNLPADRLASTSGLTDGNYRIRLTMADGVPTLTWVAE